mgnify:CR=1 FL=1
MTDTDARVHAFLARLYRSRDDRTRKAEHLAQVMTQLGSQWAYINAVASELIEQVSESARYKPESVVGVRWQSEKRPSLVGPSGIRWTHYRQGKRTQLRRVTASSVSQRCLPAYREVQAAAVDRLLDTLADRAICRVALQRLLKAFPVDDLVPDVAGPPEASIYLAALSSMLIRTADEISNVEATLDEMMLNFNATTKRAQGGLMVRWEPEPLHPFLPHGPHGPWFFLAIRDGNRTHSRRVTGSRGQRNPITKAFLSRIAYRGDLGRIVSLAEQIWDQRIHRRQLTQQLLSAAKAVKPYYYHEA